MNSFKETLKINHKRNLDEVIYREIYSRMNDLYIKLRDLGEVKNDSQALNELKEKMNYTTKVFDDIERTTEKVRTGSLQRTVTTEKGPIDIYLQEMLERIKRDICSKLKDENQKRQAYERIETVVRVFDNFDNYKANDNKRPEQEVSAER